MTEEQKREFNDNIKKTNLYIRITKICIVIQIVGLILNTILTLK